MGEEPPNKCVNILVSRDWRTAINKSLLCTGRAVYYIYRVALIWGHTILAGPPTQFRHRHQHGYPPINSSRLSAVGCGSSKPQPFHVEGLKHMGKPYVALNLPAAPQGLPHDIQDLLEPYSSEAKAGSAFLLTFSTGYLRCSWSSITAGVAAGACTGGGALVGAHIAFSGIYDSGRVFRYTTKKPAECLEEAPGFLVRVGEVNCDYHRL